MSSTPPPTKCLTIGGTDPCAAFGLLADLRTFAAWGAYGMGVVTVVTAQNSVGWYGAEFLSAEFVGAQLDAVLSDYKPQGIKTGFLGRVDLIEVIAQRLAAYGPVPLVVDPVLVNQRGAAMFGPEVTAAYRELLLPLATVITPSLDEGRLLAERPLSSSLSPAELLPTIPAKIILLTGDRHGSEMVDWLKLGEDVSRLANPYVDTRNTSGSGDTLSAALVVALARGEESATAVANARRFTHTALQASANLTFGAGPGPLMPPSG